MSLAPAMDHEWIWFLEFLARCRRGGASSADWRDFLHRFSGVLIQGIACGLGETRWSDSDRQSLVKDVLQDALFKLMRKDGLALRNFHGRQKCQLLRFLHRAGENAARDHRRWQAAARRTKLELLLDQRWNQDHDDSSGDAREFAIDRVTAFERLQIRDRVGQAVRALGERIPEKNRGRYMLIFKLHFIESSPAEKIATIPAIRLSVNGVATVISRLRQQFVREYARVVAREDRSRSRSEQSSRNPRSKKSVSGG